MRVTLIMQHAVNRLTGGGNQTYTPSLPPSLPLTNLLGAKPHPQAITRKDNKKHRPQTLGYGPPALHSDALSLENLDRIPGGRKEGKEGRREGGQEIEGIDLLVLSTESPIEPSLPSFLPPSLPICLPLFPRKRCHGPNRRNGLLCHAPCLRIQLLAQRREFPHGAEEEGGRDAEERHHRTHDQGKLPP